MEIRVRIAFRLDGNGRACQVRVDRQLLADDVDISAYSCGTHYGPFAVAEIQLQAWPCLALLIVV